MNPNAMEFWKITAGIWAVALVIAIASDSAGIYIVAAILSAGVFVLSIRQ
jgi:hypothetical protein